MSTEKRMHCYLIGARPRLKLYERSRSYRFKLFKSIGSTEVYYNCNSRVCSLITYGERTEEAQNHFTAVGKNKQYYTAINFDYQQACLPKNY